MGTSKERNFLTTVIGEGNYFIIAGAHKYYLKNFPKKYKDKLIEAIKKFHDSETIYYFLRSKHDDIKRAGIFCAINNVYDVWLDFSSGDGKLKSQFKLMDSHLRLMDIKILKDKPHLIKTINVINPINGDTYPPVEERWNLEYIPWNILFDG